ncbi:MAG TPA: glutathione S-transferase N-terminal domain-containing protein [bacterium]|nr:glutathione S-transferase N-terminal domain-containing protein [bacterium]
MIELYAWPTPNGFKISIMLEETGTPYTVHPVDIGKGEQFKPDFLAISPNNKMPAIVDTDGPGGKPISIFESGAILIYLGEKTGKFYPSEPRKKYEVLQWLMFQMGGIGPMLGQAHHFRGYAPEKLQYAIDRYTKEAGRLYGVVERQLAKHPFIAGEYSIADMAIMPWMLSWERQGQNIDDFPHVKKWIETLKARPAVAKGLQLLAEKRRQGPMDEQAKRMLFGDEQYRKRA